MNSLISVIMFIWIFGGSKYPAQVGENSRNRGPLGPPADLYFGGSLLLVRIHGLIYIATTFGVVTHLDVFQAGQPLHWMLRKCVARFVSDNSFLVGMRP